MFVEIEHPVAGSIKVCGNQTKLSNTPVNIERPHLLDSIQEILKEMLNIEEEKYNMLKRKELYKEVHEETSIMEVCPRRMAEYT